MTGFSIDRARLVLVLEMIQVEIENLPFPLGLAPWTRFSWFGVFPVEEDGSIKKFPDFLKLDISIVIATMEAVLIEGLEPRQNRQRGDDFQAIEFLQYEDPNLQLERKLTVMEELRDDLKKKWPAKCGELRT